MKKNLVVLFGGRSCEHDISIITAHQAMPYIDRDRYNVFPVYIDINGQFLYGPALEDFDFCKDIDYGKLEKVHFPPAAATLMKRKDKQVCKVDAALVCMHGLNGEDGTVQGLLELADIPYTSSGVLGCGLGMDKIAMKMFFKGMGLNVVPYTWLTREEYLDPERREAVFCNAELLEYPLMVKPSNLGSSIGITRCGNRESLLHAVEIALKFDNRVIIERAVQKMTEINCSVMGSSAGAKASVCERPLNWQSFLSFEDKYINNGKKTGGMDSLKRRIPADIPPEQTQDIQEQSVRIFRALNCKGVVRIDYIIDNETDKVFVNEINTIPGSLSYYLWEYNGIKFDGLIERLVESAIYDHSAKNRLRYAYQSNVLKGGGGTKR